MKPPCHTSSQVKHKQSQQQLLKVIKLIKNFAALLLYANLHSLTHPLTTFYLGRNLATSKTSHRWEMRTRKYFRSGKRKRSIRGKMISWKTNQRKNAIFAILNLRGCKFTDEYFLKFSRGTWKNDIFSGQSNKGSCNCKLCKSKWPEI